MGEQLHDEQQSFQVLKSKWAQQAIPRQEQPNSTSASSVVSPPPIPPKPVLYNNKQDDAEQREMDKETAAKRVSLLTQQFEGVGVTPGNFSNTSPPPTYHTNPKQNEEDEDPFDESTPGVRGHEAPTPATTTIEMHHVQSFPSVSSSSNKSTGKRPPPPPPPSKKYHSSVRNSMNAAHAPVASPIIQSPQPPPAVVNIPVRSTPNQPTETVEAVNVSPPVLPPRPIGSPLMPQLPPRPSQSTLARAHTIASAPHSKHPLQGSFTDTPSELEDDPSRIKRANTVLNKQRAMSRTELLMTTTTCPDFSRATRNAPLIVLEKPFSTGHKSSLSALAVTQNVLITGASLLRTWDAHTGTVTGTVLTENAANNNNGNSQNPDSGDKVRAIAVAPSRVPADEGRYIWVARHDNSISVVDIRNGANKILSKRHDVHMASINFLLRYGNSEIWSIDESGILNVWDVISADYHAQHNPLLTAMPRRYHVTSHAVAATIYGSKLWMSSGRTLAAHAIPVAGSQQGSNDTKSQTPVRIPNDLGNITKLITIPYYHSRIFASHDDGKISVWDAKTMERLQVITVSMYGICTMASVGEYHVWAGYNTGMIYVYDTRPEKWAVLKMWKAHTGAVTQLVVDESSLILDEIKGRLQVVSSDSNGFVGVWDGLLIEHWKDEHLQKRSKEYCSYDDAHVMICSWNIDANKPEKIVGQDDKAVREWLGTMEDPDIIVVGIQEIVDLESKKQTARSLFARKKVDPNEPEDVLTHRYKLWHDYLIRIISENYGYHNYTVLKTDQMVGLFSCIFVRTSDLNRVFDVDSTSVKTGLKVMNKSIHGNKGGIAIRFVYDHSSLCFVNCHLAAGQNHMQQRNADAEGILQSASFPRHDYADVFVHGGDGSMILDHEFCFLSGDLNYRIKMARKDVLRVLTSNDKQTAWSKLQEQDQLLRQRINNPLFKLLTFEEAPIQFDPTYKYDPGTDFYDSSEKKRVPAWCDRVLYKGKNIKNLFYRRYEPRCSDHRPIAAGFSFQTKITDQKKRDVLMSKIEEEWREQIDRFIKDKKARYVADYELCSLSEAFNRLEKSDWDVNDAVIKLLGSI
ncbi:hypothetical protein CU098_009101 [Rhizopus stolonifer]|uniref:Inositol polyphosphate-related phosphatase domain-containing protein n=1 Tax=Rhizopus stolonifer TaxID=4846 RepID=A0A367KPU1_RHIST|nr:hypothetical protein CU098_009101 [Rhizopus stolonifer]